MCKITRPPFLGKGLYLCLPLWLKMSPASTRTVSLVMGHHIIIWLLQWVVSWGSLATPVGCNWPQAVAPDRWRGVVKSMTAFGHNHHLYFELGCIPTATLKSYLWVGAVVQWWWWPLSQSGVVCFPDTTPRDSPTAHITAKEHGPVQRRTSWCEGQCRRICEKVAYVNI